MGRCSKANRCQRYSHDHECDQEQTYNQSCFQAKPGMRPGSHPRVLIGILLFGMGFYLLGFIQAVMTGRELGMSILGLCLFFISALIFEVRVPLSSH